MFHPLRRLLHTLSPTPTPSSFLKSPPRPLLTAPAPAPSPLLSRPHFRNLAVIAHVDHGKTTLVDAMLRHSGTLREARNRVMDSKDQERERGITILAKHTSLLLPALPGGRGEEGRGVTSVSSISSSSCSSVSHVENRINLVDTPGHLDFGGEVERALQMVEGFLLLVDAHEGVKPGTRYVLRKALDLRLKPIVVFNKMDMEDCDIAKAENQVQDLILDLATDADQLDLTMLYGSGRAGYMNTTPEENGGKGTLQPLFDAIYDVIPPPTDTAKDAPLRMLVGNVDVLPDGTRLAIGRVFAGSLVAKQIITVVLGDLQEKAQVKKIEVYRGVERIEVPNVGFGDIAIVHLTEPKGKSLPLEIGATLCHEEHIVPWPYVKPEDPTYTLILREMGASWKETEIKDKDKSRFMNLRKYLQREAMNNTALRLAELPGTSNAIQLQGRGLLHIGVLLEDMRRAGYEFELQAPDTVTKVINGTTHEPFERLSLEFKVEHLAAITQLLTSRHAELGETEVIRGDRVVQHCEIATRLLGDLNLRVLRLTAGDAVVQTEVAEYRPCLKNATTRRATHALVSVDHGTTTNYALSLNKEHGVFFVGSGTVVFYGQVIGETTAKQTTDLPLNVTKEKELTNFRANAMDAARRTQVGFRYEEKSLEEALSWITPEELVVVTPKSVRIRKCVFDGKTRKR